MSELDLVENSEYEAARTKRNEIRNRLRRIDAEIAEINTDVWRNQQEADDLDKAAEALLAGEQPEAVLANVEQRLEALHRDRHITMRALGIAQRQFADEKDKIATAAAEELRPSHKLAVRRIADALTELVAANADEQACRAKCPYGDARMVPAMFPGVGSPDAIDSRIWLWFKHVERNGLIDDGDNPAAMPDAAD